MRDYSNTEMSNIIDEWIHSRRDREALKMAYIDGETHEYIAEKLQISPRTVNRLIPDEKVDPVDVIPADWYAHVKQDVDINTKRTAVKNGFEKWVEWEKQTKDLYQRMYKELVEIGEIDSSLFIGDCIKDVSHELEKAEYMHINLASVDYAIDCILDVQDQLHDEYAEKIKAC